MNPKPTALLRRFLMKSIKEYFKNMQKKLAPKVKKAAKVAKETSTQAWTVTKTWATNTWFNIKVAISYIMRTIN